ncbi:hypothetical protein BDZ89DRAFT_965613, partial [Hymenopellis radicata]
SIFRFTLLQYFSKFGPISAFDFLFHHSGPHKGKPRGFAFIEYEHADHADKAISAAHTKSLRGKSLIVTYAAQAPDYSSNGGVVRRKTLMESGRPTALSMLKEKGAKRDKQDKIALMEAKLRQMEATSLPTEPKAMSSSLPSKPEPSVQATGLQRKPIKRPSSSLPRLPPKPSVVDLPKPQVALPPKPKIPEKKKPLLAGVKIVKRKPDTSDTTTTA